MIRKRLAYFDTSSINFINNWVDTQELTLLRKGFIKQYNCLPTISPLNLYEILNSSNEQTRDDLILTCQNFFDRKIFPTPCEILDNYIIKNTPLIEHGDFKVNGSSKSANLWKEIHFNQRKTLIIDTKSMEESRNKIYKLSQFIYYAINNNFSSIDSSNDDLHLLSVINDLYDLFTPILRKHGEDHVQKEVFYKTNIFFIFFVLDFFDSDFNNVTDFWLRRKIILPDTRICYILNHLNSLLFRGPTVLMSLMAANQAKYKYSRGFLLDCLHAGYYSYCDYLVTNDPHFEKFSIDISDHLPCKILNIAKINSN